jgi:hypothetical protein
MKRGRDQFNLPQPHPQLDVLDRQRAADPFPLRRGRRRSPHSTFQLLSWFRNCPAWCVPVTRPPVALAWNAYISAGNETRLIST